MKAHQAYRLIVSRGSLTPSLLAPPDRVDPRCPYFGECGGCHWQHARYEAQLGYKRKAVEDVWSRAGLRLPPDTPVLGMDDPWRYRIRCRAGDLLPQRCSTDFRVASTGPGNSGGGGRPLP